MIPEVTITLGAHSKTCLFTARKFSGIKNVVDRRAKIYYIYDALQAKAVVITA